MIIDKQETLSDGQTGITSTAASTSYYDAGAKGDAIGSKLWVVVRVNVKLDSTNHTATVQAQVETADDSAFTTNKTVIASGSAVVVTALPAGTILLKAQLGVGLRQYTRINYVVGVESLNAGSVDAFLVSDVDDLLS